jgi:hypothetical protein
MLLLLLLLLPRLRVPVSELAHPATTRAEALRSYVCHQAQIHKGDAVQLRVQLM